VRLFASIVGILGIAFGVLQFSMPDGFALWYRRGMPAVFREQVSKATARMVVRMAGVAFVVFGSLLLVLGLALRP
jgi:hypothetical protein